MISRRLILFFIICFGSMQAMDVCVVALEKTELAEKIAAHYNQPVITPLFQQFSDGELNVVLEDPAQFKDQTIVLVQSTGRPVNEHLLGISFLAHELKNADAKKIVAVIPYFGYARQERSKIEGKPGHGWVVAQLLEKAGVDEIITVELHDPKLLSFFSIPIHNLSPNSIIAKDIQKQIGDLSAVCMIAPDKGAQEQVEAIADELGVGTLVFSKERFAKDQTRVLAQEGTCTGRIAILIDDIIATGGTAINVCSELKNQNFQTVYGYFVHPVLAGNAVERIKDSCFDTVFVGNTYRLYLQRYRHLILNRLI